MPLYVFLGNDGTDGLELRKLHRPAHLSGIDALDADNRLHHAGPILDESGAPIGSLVLFEAASLAEAQQIAGNDPYVVEGVFESWRVNETRRVRGRA
jgi:uncharacterized protein YciI